MDQAQITEQVTRSWYTYTEGNDAALPPYKGETDPNYTGPAPPYQWLNTGSKYTWLKAPRYDGQVIEVGPLARALVAYAAGVPAVKQAVDATLTRLGATPAALHSTLGRVIARALETMIVVDQLEGWLDQLDGNMTSGDLRIADTAKSDPSSWPSHARASRASTRCRAARPLGRDLGRNDPPLPGSFRPPGTPAPRDTPGQPSRYQQALVGTPVADPERPLELLRTVHSFDPCLACAVRVLGAEHAGESQMATVELGA